MDTAAATLSSVMVGLGPSAGHPRVFMGASALLQANSWMVVPSTTMTKEGRTERFRACPNTT
jgi:hypothetical protein